MVKSVPVTGCVKSQSPLIGAFVPGNLRLGRVVYTNMSQSPLIGAFVPGNMENKKSGLYVKVSIPSDRGIRSGGVGMLIRVFSR